MMSLLVCCIRVTVTWELGRVLGTSRLSTLLPPTTITPRINNSRPSLYLLQNAGNDTAAAAAKEASDIGVRLASHRRRAL